MGNPHASIIFQNGWCFEEYIELLAEYTRDEPYVAVLGDYTYEIYTTRDPGVRIPFDVEFDISGNNIDGFVVTIWY